MDRKIYETYLKILHSELVPAMGCTEPIAIALTAAKAKEYMTEEIKSVSVCVSGNIIKNVKSVKDYIERIDEMIARKTQLIL